MQYKERMCAVPGESYLQYEEKVIQYEERVYSTRIATSDVGGQGVWCEEKLYSMKNVIPAVLGEKVCSTRKVATTLRGEGCAMRGERVYSISKVTSAVGGRGVCCEEKVYSIKNVTSAVAGEKCAVPRRARLQYEEKVVQCKERVYSIRKALSPVGR